MPSRAEAALNSLYFPNATPTFNYYYLSCCHSTGRGEITTKANFQKAPLLTSIHWKMHTPAAAAATDEGRGLHAFPTQLLLRVIPFSWKAKFDLTVYGGGGPAPAKLPGYFVKWGWTRSDF